MEDTRIIRKTIKDVYQMLPANWSNITLKGLGGLRFIYQGDIYKVITVFKQYNEVVLFREVV
jgi:hypothetical protein